MYFLYQSQINCWDNGTSKGNIQSQSGNSNLTQQQPHQKHNNPRALARKCSSKISRVGCRNMIQFLRKISYLFNRQTHH
jgi:hypothetical protein